MTRRRIVTPPATVRSRRADVRPIHPGRAVEHAVLRDRGAPRDHAFVASDRSEDTLAERMGRAAVLSFTSGQDEPLDAREGDEREDALLPIDFGDDDDER